ncbi:MAG: hypothetical protein LQ349_008182, partial [Xanthoria aureola]
MIWLTLVASSPRTVHLPLPPSAKVMSVLLLRWTTMGLPAWSRIWQRVAWLGTSLPTWSSTKVKGPLEEGFLAVRGDPGKCFWAGVVSGAA